MPKFLDVPQWYDSEGTLQEGMPLSYFRDNYWGLIEDGVITPAIGETKTIKISGSEYKIQCIGLNHDDLVSGGKAKTTWQLVDTYTSYPMNTSSTTNEGGWEDCGMRSWLNSTIFSKITDEDGNSLSSRIKQVVKRTANGGSQGGTTVVTSDDYLFLPSVVEVFGTTRYEGFTQYAYAGEGNQYEFYSSAPIPEPTSGTGQFTPLKEHSSTGTFYTADTSVADGWVDKYGGAKITTVNARYNYNCIKGAAGGTSSVNWWLRSPYRNNTNSFCIAIATSTLSYIVTNNSWGVSFCFCI